MSGNSKPAHTSAEPNTLQTEFHGYSDIVDYILGITFEIWEQRQVETILDYYGEDIDVFSMEGITQGAAEMVKQTHATLTAYPDRLLLAENVIWSGSLARGFSSHRLTSPMTNRGASGFGPATGRKVRTMNVADCEITDGKITREWLLRDNLALATQLGVDIKDTIKSIADRFDDTLVNWLRQEFSRVQSGSAYATQAIGEHAPDAHNAFARRVLENCWINGKQRHLQADYAPYVFMQRAPTRIFSGRRETLEHYASWRQTFLDPRLCVDHVCSQPSGINSTDIAVRWSIAGTIRGNLAGLATSDAPVYLVGATHWKTLNGRIVAEWTVFDELSLAAQSMSAAI